MTPDPADDIDDRDGVVTGDALASGEIIKTTYIVDPDRQTVRIHIRTAGDQVVVQDDTFRRLAVYFFSGRTIVAVGVDSDAPETVEVRRTRRGEPSQYCKGGRARINGPVSTLVAPLRCFNGLQQIIGRSSVIIGNATHNVAHTFDATEKSASIPLR